MARLRTKETESPTWAFTTSILHLSIESSQAKGKLGKNTKVLQGTKGMQTQAQVLATMDYSSLALNSSCLKPRTLGCVQKAKLFWSFP